MKIKEVSNITGLTGHTLRYYEKIGLLQISKDTSGHRNYTNEDISWIQFINRLKITGMPIKDIVKYSDLRAKGNPTLKDRLKLLEDHELRITNNISKLEYNLDELKKKINYYKGKIY